jgi:hypothetical protein
MAQLISAAANGEPLPDWAPKTLTDLDRLNAEIAERNAGRTRRQALELLRLKASEATAQLRRLSDEQLERKILLPAIGREFSPQEIAQIMSIGHIAMHIPSIQKAVAPAG